MNTKFDDRIPVSLELLHRMIDIIPTLGLSGYNKVMLKSLFTIMFHGFLRPGEISGSLHNIQYDMCIVFKDCVSIQFLSYKHCKGKPYRIEIPISGDKYCPVYLLCKFLKIRGKKSGPFFSTKAGKLLLYSFVSKIVKLLVKVLNINGVLTSHSFGIGAATWAAKQGVTLEIIMRMYRWSSTAVKNYIRVPCVKLSKLQ